MVYALYMYSEKANSLELEFLSTMCLVILKKELLQPKYIQKHVHSTDSQGKRLTSKEDSINDEQKVLMHTMSKTNYAMAPVARTLYTWLSS